MPPIREVLECRHKIRLFRVETVPLLTYGGAWLRPGRAVVVQVKGVFAAESAGFRGKLRNVGRLYALECPRTRFVGTPAVMTLAAQRSPRGGRMERAGYTFGAGVLSFAKNAKSEPKTITAKPA